MELWNSPIAVTVPTGTPGIRRQEKRKHLQSLLCCAGKTRWAEWYHQGGEILGASPFANERTLFGPPVFPWGQTSGFWPTRCRERKCCWSPVYFLGWPPACSRRTGCRPVGTCTVPPQSTFVRWTWSGLLNASRNMYWSLWSKGIFK